MFAVRKSAATIFDFLEEKDYPNAPFSIVVGDISGHGLDSALLMTTARAFLRMRAPQYGTFLKSLLK